MLTGRPADHPPGAGETLAHGYFGNFPGPDETVHAQGNPAVPYKASIFDVAHDRGLSTALYSSKAKLIICARSYDAENGAPDLIGQDHGRAKLDKVVIEENNTPLILSSLLEQIGSGLHRFTFLHICDVDYAGHEFSERGGWRIDPDAFYRATVRTVDSWLGSILDALAANPALNGKVALLLTADHGGGGAGALHTHVDPTDVVNCAIPFFVRAPGLTGGSELYSHLQNRTQPGTTLPPSGEAGQPIRNADVANLSAALLGLPEVPGSFSKPALRKPVRVHREGERVFVRWPAYLTRYTLEATEDLAAGAWQPVAAPITEASGENQSEVAQPIPRARFFRLRPPAEAIIQAAPRVAEKQVAPAVSATPQPKRTIKKRRYLLTPDGSIRRR
jgi:hypothetical protein